MAGSQTNQPLTPPSERALLPPKRWCAEERGYIPRSGPARVSASRPMGESPDCAPWPIPGEAGRGRVQSPERLRRLAADWLRPFASGIFEDDLMPRLGYNRSHCDRVSPSRICPLVIVRRGEIFVYIPVTSRLFPEVLPACSNLGGNTPGGASMRRLLTVLRFLRSTLSTFSWWGRRDFAIRVCVDEFCHGMFEDRLLPWLTMISCASSPSLPAVQWSTLKGRDPNLSEWDALLAEQTALADVANASWPCRTPRAVWRGSASEPFTTNMRWTGNHTLERIPISIGKWRAQVAPPFPPHARAPASPLPSLASVACAFAHARTPHRVGLRSCGSCATTLTCSTSTCGGCRGPSRASGATCGATSGTRGVSPRWECRSSRSSH